MEAEFLVTSWRILALSEIVEAWETFSKILLWILKETEIQQIQEWSWILKQQQQKNQKTTPRV